MHIKVTPAEVERFARMMHQWSNEVQNLHNQVKGNTERLRQHWDDPQFQLFVEVITAHNANLSAAEKSFAEVSKGLLAIARQLEETIKLTGQQLEQVRRR